MRPNEPMTIIKSFLSDAKAAGNSRELIAVINRYTMASARFFSVLSIGTRIYSGFAMVLALLVLVAITGIAGLSVTSNSFSSYERAAGGAVNISVIDRSVVSMLSNVLLYVNGDANALPRIREGQAEIVPLLKEALENADAGEKEAIARISKLVADYSTNVDRLIELKQKREHLIHEVMRPLEEEAQAKLAMITKASLDADDNRGAALSGVAQQALMSTLLNSTRFSVKSDVTLIDHTKAHVQSFVDSTEKLAGYIIDPQLVDESYAAGKLGPKYREAFIEMAKAVSDADKLTNEVMAAQSAEISKLARDTGSHLRKELNQTTKETVFKISATRSMAVALAIGAAVLGIFLAWGVASGIVLPVKAITETMKALASGNKLVDVPVLEHKDEIGNMARAVQVFKNNAVEMDRLQEQNELQKQHAEASQRQAMHTLADNFEASVRGIVQIVSAQASEMENSARALSSVAEKTVNQASVVASASTHATKNVSAVATTTRDLSASIIEIGKQVDQSARVAQSAANEAGRVNEIVAQLATAAQKIGEIISLINDIASQTNLLALNATIEAARAGDAGKGFAVVAGEVKNLATQTAKATEDITAQIGSVQSATQEAVVAIRGITDTIVRINEIASTISSAVEEQGVATAEIARNVEEASTGVTEVSRNITEVTGASKETGTASARVLDAARQLAEQSDLLKADVDKFIAHVRS